MERASRRRRAAATSIIVAATLGVAAEAAAESAWVKDHMQLNLRTGAGTRYRIVASIETGDSVDVLERGEKWTKVRFRGTEEGWIPAGYLQEEMPARARLARIETEAADLRERIEVLTLESERMQQENAGLGNRDTAQKQEIERLTRQNAALLAGARWPEWLAGASILSTGLICGAWVRGRGDRRGKARIRL